MKVYKIRNTDTKLYSCGGYVDVKWNKYGKTWNNMGFLSSHLAQHINGNLPSDVKLPNNWEVVEFELQENYSINANDYYLKAKKFTLNDSILLINIIDRSKSMNIITDEVIKGFNEALGKQKNLHLHTWIHDVLFDGKIKIYKDKKFSPYKILHYFNCLQNLSLAPFTNNNYVPQGDSTSLTDAIGRTIDEVRYVLSTDIRYINKFTKILVTILTDGEDNSSTVYSKNDVMLKINECKNNGWNFLLLGANMDSLSVGSSYGIDNNFDFETYNEKMPYLFNALAEYYRTFSITGKGISISEMNKLMKEPEIKESIWRNK